MFTNFTELGSKMGLVEFYLQVIEKKIYKAPQFFGMRISKMTHLWNSCPRLLKCYFIISRFLFCSLLGFINWDVRREIRKTE